MRATLTGMGRRIRGLRDEAGLTQEQLASAAGLSVKYISELEHGHANPSLEVLHAVAEKGLNLSLAAFFSYDTTGTEAQDEVRTVAALLASQPRPVRLRVLHVVKALLEPLGDTGGLPEKR